MPAALSGLAPARNAKIWSPVVVHRLSVGSQLSVVYPEPWRFASGPPTGPMYSDPSRRAARYFPSWETAICEYPVPILAIRTCLPVRHAVAAVQVSRAVEVVERGGSATGRGRYSAWDWCCTGMPWLLPGGYFGWPFTISSTDSHLRAALARADQRPQQLRRHLGELGLLVGAVAIAPLRFTAAVLPDSVTPPMILVSAGKAVWVASRQPVLGRRYEFFTRRFIRLVVVACSGTYTGSGTR